MSPCVALHLGLLFEQLGQPVFVYLRRLFEEESPITSEFYAHR